MAVGTLNVSIVANTRPANAAVRDFRGNLRGIPADATVATTALVQLESQIRRTGDTLDEIQAKYARLAATPAPFSGGSNVDLSAQVGRYAALERQLERTASAWGLYRNAMKLTFTVMRAASFVGIVGGLTATVVAAFKGRDAWLSLGQAVMSFTGLDSIVGKVLGADEIDRRSRALDQEIQKIRQRQQTIEEGFARELAAIQLRRRTAEVGGDRAQWEVDRRTMGAAKANQLLQARLEAANAESWAAKERRAEEEKIEALRRRQERQRQQAERQAQAARDARRKEIEIVTGLEKELADFWKTAAQRRRDDALAAIADPAIRARARLRLDQLEAAEAVRADRDRQRQDDQRRADRGGVDPLDARTVAGWQALRANLAKGPQEELVDVGREALAEHQETNRLLGVLGRGGPGFDPFAN